MPRMKDCLIALVVLALMLVWASKAWSYEVDMEAIKQIESSGNPLAFNSHSKARGLYAITPICLKHFNMANKTSIKPSELFNQDINTKVSVWYFGWLKGRCSSITEVLIAYNWGLGNLRRWDGDYNKLPKETRQYLIRYKELIV